MCAADEVHVVFVQELLNNLSAKGERHTAVVLAPALRVPVGICPQEIAQQARVGHVGGAHNAADLNETQNKHNHDKKNSAKPESKSLKAK